MFPFRRLGTLVALAGLGLWPAPLPGQTFEGRELVFQWRLRTVHEQTADEWGILLRNLFSPAGLDIAKVDGIIICSVVPPIDSTLAFMTQRYFHTEAMFVGPRTDIGLRILYDNPNEVGADRLVLGSEPVRIDGEVVGRVTSGGYGYTVDSSIQITADVPAAAATGPISVTTAGGTTTSASSFKAVPTITGFAPGSAASGTPVTVDRIYPNYPQDIVVGTNVLYVLHPDGTAPVDADGTSATLGDFTTVGSYYAGGGAISDLDANGHKEVIGASWDTQQLIALDGKKVDPFHLQLYKEGTIVLVPPPNTLNLSHGGYGGPGGFYPHPQPDGSYHHVWKTSGDWAGTCRRLTLGFDDGSRYSADFRFR